MENVAHSTARPNKVLANRSIKYAHEITQCINELGAVLRKMQILNIQHDIGSQQINEIMPMFIKKRADLLKDAKQLRNG